MRSSSAAAARVFVLVLLSGASLALAGVSRAARDEFYRKLPALVEQYHFPVAEFQDHDEDPAFLIRQQPHLTAKGWAYYDRALDDFFHGRSPRH